MNCDFHVPPSIIFGGGKRFEAGHLAEKMGLSRVLIITDKFLSETGAVSSISDCLKERGLEFSIFCDLKNEPAVEDVLNAVDVLMRNNCDGVLSVGGGSAIDTAKAVCVLSANGGKMSDFQGYQKVKKRGLPHIAIPTTAGTGSEVTRVTIINDTSRNVKMMCLDNFFMPDAAIVDYELTLTMPKTLTAYVGLDALTHAIEAYVSKKANALSNIYATEAIRLISGSIMDVYKDGGNLNARENMMIASTYAGIAFSNASVCTVHGMSRPIGVNFHVPHGLSNAFLLPIVTKKSINGDVQKYADIAITMGFDSSGKTVEQLALGVVEKLEYFNKELNIPNMKGWGIDETRYMEAIDFMIDAAVDSGSPGNNPKVFSKEELAQIYRSAFNYVSGD